MTKFEQTVEALKTSLVEIATAGRPDRDEAMAKSVGQFATLVHQMYADDLEATEALSKRAPDPASMDHVALLGGATMAAAEAIEAIEAGTTQMNTAMVPPSEALVVLAKTALDMLGCAVQMMANEQATPFDEQTETLGEGLGLAKVDMGGQEIMLKHTLSEPAMSWLQDPSAVLSEGIGLAFDYLAGLGVNVDPLIKAFDEENDPDQDGDQDGAGGADPDQDGAGDGDGAGDDDGAGDGEDEGGDDPDDLSGASPFVDLARLGSMIMATADAVREQALADGAQEDELEAIKAIAQHGAFVTVQADSLERAAMGEMDEPGADEPGADEPGADEPGADEPGADEPGADEPGADAPGADAPAPKPAPKPGASAPPADPEEAKKEKAMALAAHSHELAKRARARLGIVAPAAPLAKAAPLPGPTLNTIGISKMGDQGRPDAETQQAMAKRMAEQPLEKTQVEMLKMALSGRPVPA